MDSFSNRTENYPNVICKFEVFLTMNFRDDGSVVRSLAMSHFFTGYQGFLISLSVIFSYSGLCFDSVYVRTTPVIVKIAMVE